MLASLATQRLSVLVLATLTLALAPSALPPAAPVPDGGTEVLPANWSAGPLKAWKGDTTFGALAATDAGLKLTTHDKPEFIYSLQALVLNEKPVKSGDVLLLRFAARSVKAEAATGATRLRVSFGKSSPPWGGGTRADLALTKEWQWFDIPFKSTGDFEAKGAQVNFSFGFTPQEAEIAAVSVLDFGPNAPIASLPRTKRYADEIPAAIVDRELARIAEMRRQFDAVADPSPAHGKTIYVAPAGKPNAAGTADAPFATIPQALKVAAPGDTVLVGAGEYHEPSGISIKTSGTPDAWIKIKAAPGTRPKILTSNWSGIELRQGICYIEIDGLELQFVKDPKYDVHGCGIAPMYASHHIRILNNVVHDYGTGGICSLDCDYMYLEGNVVYHTSHTSPYGGSGISLCRSFNFDENPGYHNVVRRNVCYDNENKVNVLETSGGNGKTLTDGNGIIIDVFQRSRKNPLKPHGEDRNGPLEPYRGRTLVENNLCFDNGGRGVHIFRSSKVDVINNTCYMNQKTAEINGGELTSIEGQDIVIANNLAVARPGKRVSGQDGSTGFIIWTHDLLSGEDALRHKDGLFDVDPMFAGAALTAKPEGFRLLPGSPALGKGIASIAPPVDLDGNPRPPGAAVDLGAFQISK